MSFSLPALRALGKQIVKVDYIIIERKTQETEKFGFLETDRLPDVTLFKILLASVILYITKGSIMT